MNTWYCVNAEFYGGKILACVTSNKKRGKSQYRQFPGMSAFKMWFVSESMANQLVESIKDGSVDCEDVLSIWSGQDWENETFFKGAAA